MKNMGNIQHAVSIFNVIWQVAAVMQPFAAAAC